MSSVISDLERSHPEMDIYSFVSNTEEIEQKLLRRELDVAVVEGIIESPELICVPIVEDSLVLVCGKTHDWRDANSPCVKKGAAPGSSSSNICPHTTFISRRYGRQTVPGRL